ncbi:MAG TPA: helix-turn-helix transcriptional regulator [Tissierellaceae bacterium]|nr:helix-turn-helix transcriptional regulator [Tissierellaceae bacterium]
MIDIVKKGQPITSEAIAGKLNLNRSTLRPDLAILTMSGILDARPKVGYFHTGKDNLTYISEKIKSIKVKDVKSMPIIIDESVSLYDAIVSIFLEDVGSIYVSNEGFLSGIVSRKDFIKSAIGGMDLNKVPIGMIMTRMPNVIFVEDEDSILDAAVKLIEQEVDSLPVIQIDSEDEKKYKIIGKITKTTITRLFVELGLNQ